LKNNPVTIQFETTEPYAFLNSMAAATTRWVAIWDQFLFQKYILCWT